MCPDVRLVRRLPSLPTRGSPRAVRSWHSPRWQLRASFSAVPGDKAAPALGDYDIAAAGGEPSPAVPTRPNEPQGYELPRGWVGHGEGLGLPWTQPPPPFLQSPDSVALGWPGPSGTSMGCSRSSCWRMRGSGRAQPQLGDLVPTPHCCVLLPSCPLRSLAPSCPHLPAGLVLHCSEGLTKSPTSPASCHLSGASCHLSGACASQDREEPAAE